jgi:hypothetical protein
VVATKLGAIRLPYQQFDMFASIASAFPAGKPRDEIGRAVWGQAYSDVLDGEFRTLLHRTRKAVAKVGLEVTAPYKRPYRVVTLTGVPS